MQDRLFRMQDLEYKEFQSKLIPNVPAENVIGVRVPDIRKLAKEVAGTVEAEKFLHELPHRYYDENMLHACLLENIKEYDACVKALNEFLPYIDNWAVCDMRPPKVLKKNLDRFYEEQIKGWIASEHTYTIRFGIGMLMRFYLEDAFSMEYADLVASIRSEEYYVNMMIAWYFATALAKQYAAVLPILTEQRLDVWTHNKTIQKAMESFRITAEQKEFLKGLKITVDKLAP